MATVRTSWPTSSACPARPTVPSGEAYRPLETASLAAVPGIRANAAGEVSDIAEQSDVIENDLIWTGMVGIIDPPRTEVRDSVARPAAPASAPS